MNIITLTKQNIEDEHICCAISDKKSLTGYLNKKQWLKTEFKNAYHFQKFDVRGKVFIEYVPIEASWLPLEGKNFMVINCFWVSGQFKGHGHGKKLLEQCINDAKAEKMDGIIAISSNKKRPFMSDPHFFKYQGFRMIDEAEPFFKLWGLIFDEKVSLPRIRKSAKKGHCHNNGGIVAYYSDSCPFSHYYTNEVLRTYAKERNIPCDIHHIDSQQKGHNMPIPWIINSVFYKGKLITLEMKAQKYLDKVISHQF